MASVEIRATGSSVDIPSATLAILQFDAETSRAPAQNLWHLEMLHTNRWRSVRWFNERDYGGALGGPSPYSATVLGYNSVAFAAGVRAQLDDEPPRGPLVVLHQRDTGCYGFLRDRLALRIQRVPPGLGDAGQAWAPKERHAIDEILLRFPQRVLKGEESIEARAVNWFAFAPDSAWRVVLELRLGTRRLPVLIRTADVEEQRVIACSLLLEPTDPLHADLLENMISYAAIGWPEIAVVDLEDRRPDGYDARAITSRLQLQAARAVRTPARTAAELDLDDWPVRGARRLVVPGGRGDDLLGLEALQPWLARGGVALRVDGHDRMTLAGAGNEAQWVVRRWALWYHGCPPARWQGSLFTSRAVLRMLSALHRDHAQLVGALGIAEKPEAHRRAVARLLASRVRGGSVEETVGATAAALDLDKLVGGAMMPRTASAARGWLERAFEDASLADRLDIARVLTRGDLLADALAKDRPALLTAVEATRLREAAFACAGQRPEIDFRPLAEPVAGDSVADDLRRAGALSAAELIAAWARLRDSDAQHPLNHLGAEVEQVALDRLAASRSLADEGLQAPDAGHDISIESYGLLHLLGREQGSTWIIPAGAREFPPNAVSAVIGEVTQARQAEQQARRDLPAIGTAVLLLGAAALAALVVAVLDAARLAVSVDMWTGVAAVGTFALCLVALGAYRWYALRGQERERHELVLAQVVLTASVLVAGLAVLIHVIRASVVEDTVAIGLMAAVLAGFLFLLWRAQLAPRWTADLLAILSEPKGLLTWVQRKQSSEPPTKGP